MLQNQTQLQDSPWQHISFSALQKGHCHLQSVKTTQTDVNFIHHAFETSNDGLHPPSYIF